MIDRQTHWDDTYTAKAETEVSWYQAHPDRSLELIKSAFPGPASIIDVGGGASGLVDALVAEGWVHADDSDHARHRMHMATRTALASGEGIKAPWISTALVSCTGDSSFEVPPDKALLANGKITLKLP